MSERDVLTLLNSFVAGKKVSCRQLRLDQGHDVLRETHGTLTLHECVKGIHDESWIVWDGDRCIAVGDEQWARRHLPGGDRFGHSKP